jgi:hypothetical protein
MTILALCACTTVHREAAPGSTMSAAAPAGFEPEVRYLSTDPRVPGARFVAVLEHLKATNPDRAPNILALSGGGAGGAFGAGALVGLSRRGERPRFDIVTGVSAGALIAPFAFAGLQWDEQLSQALAGSQSQGLLAFRGVGALFNPGLFHGEPLADLVQRYVSDDLIRAVAEQASQGRALLVATTDLDKEETVVWDMGLIASRGDEAARTLFRQVLIASASVPGVFPPVVIGVTKDGRHYEEMHVDGGVTVPFFVAPDLAYILPLVPNGLEGANIYVLVNSQLGGEPRTTADDTISIIGRSSATTLKHLTRNEITLTAELASRYGMNFRFSEIPVDYPFRGAFDFGEAATRALFDYALACARDGRLWLTVEQAIARNTHASLVGASTAEGAEKSGPTPCPDDGSVMSIRTDKSAGTIH